MNNKVGKGNAISPRQSRIWSIYLDCHRTSESVNLFSLLKSLFDFLRFVETVNFVKCIIFAVLLEK